MATTRLTTLILTGLLLAACGPSEPPPADTAPPAATEAARPAQSAAPDSDDAPDPATTPEALVEESTGDVSDGDSIRLAGEKKPAQGKAPWKYQQGEHYEAFSSAQGTSSPPDKIEVAEVFWYGCPHCYNFEPFVGRWKQDLDADVNFVRIPVMWNPTNEIHARIFYTVEVLDPSGALHDAVFKAIHRDKNMLTSEDKIRELFTSNGISAEKFNTTFRGFAVNGKLNQARDFTNRYRIRSVPIMIVNGKYSTPGPDVKGFDQLLDVVDELVEKERTRS